MAVTKNYNAFPSFTKDGRNYILARSGRHPIDETSIFTSLALLKQYIADTTGVAFPGQIVAVADDTTAGTNTASRSEQGLYYINNTTAGGNVYTASKIALLSDIDGSVSSDVKELIENQVNPSVTLLNLLFGSDNTIWEEYTEDGGYNPETIATSLNDIIYKQNQTDAAIYTVSNGDTI